MQTADDILGRDGMLGIQTEGRRQGFRTGKLSGVALQPPVAHSRHFLGQLGPAIEFGGAFRGFSQFALQAPPVRQGRGGRQAHQGDGRQEQLHHQHHGGRMLMKGGGRPPAHQGEGDGDRRDHHQAPCGADHFQFEHHQQQRGQHQEHQGLASRKHRHANPGQNGQGEGGADREGLEPQIVRLVAQGQQQRHHHHGAQAVGGGPRPEHQPGIAIAWAPQHHRGEHGRDQGRNQASDQDEADQVTAAGQVQRGADQPPDPHRRNHNGHQVAGGQGHRQPRSLARDQAGRQVAKPGGEHPEGPTPGMGRQQKGDGDRIGGPDRHAGAQAGGQAYAPPADDGHDHADAQGHGRFTPRARHPRGPVGTGGCFARGHAVAPSHRPK